MKGKFLCVLIVFPFAVLFLFISANRSYALMGGAVQGRDLNLNDTNAYVTTLAGSAGSSGITDGTGSAARFNTPNGITTDGTNLYIADTNNQAIRRVVIATGAVTTLAGSADSSGSVDGTGSAARFCLPGGITTDGTNLYVADDANHTIRKIVITTGVVTTVAGSAGNNGSTDGTGSAAKFNEPRSITTDGTNLYVADTYNHTIRKIEIATRVVTTLAGLALSRGSADSTDGTGSSARFYNPTGIMTDGSNLYVSDTGNSTIRKVVIATGQVTTLAGLAESYGFNDGTGSAARFQFPAGITTDGTNLYVAEPWNDTIRKVVIATGTVTTLAGAARSPGSADALGSAARFYNPAGITTDGTNIYVSDTLNHTIRKISTSVDNIAPTVTGVAASSPTDSRYISVTITAGDTGGSGLAAYLVTVSSTPPEAAASGWSTANPFVCTVTKDGTYTLYGWAKDAMGNVSAPFTPVTVVVSGSTPIAGTSPAANNATFGINGVINVAFSQAMDASTINSATFIVKSGATAITGTVSYNASTLTATFIPSSSLSYNVSYTATLTANVKDATGNSLGTAFTWGFATRGTALMGGSIQDGDLNLNNATAMVTTFAGSTGSSGSANGIGSAARFNHSYGTATDGTSLYVADTSNNAIRRIIIATGAVTTLVEAAAGLYAPTGITTDGTNLYMADQGNRIIRKIVIATGTLSTLAGSAGLSGSADGTGSAARFYEPRDLTTDGINLYVADQGDHSVRKIVIATQEVTTLAGSGSSGSADGKGHAASFRYPMGIVTDGTNLYVADTGNNTIRKVMISDGTVTTLAGSADSSGSVDGTGSAARFDEPTGITSDGTNLYVTEQRTGLIRKIAITTGVVKTLAGSAYSYGSADGMGSAAGFNIPNGITTDGANLYVADLLNYTIRKISALIGGAIQGRDLNMTNASVTTFAGSAGNPGSDDGTSSAARFDSPNGTTTDGTNLYVADSSNRTIRKVVIATREVTTLAGTAGSAGSADGTGSMARFDSPAGITTDGTNLYIGDNISNTIRKIVIVTGEVTTLAGLYEHPGSADGTGSTARFSGPSGITTDGTNLYVADQANNTIRKIVIATGTVTTLAGSANIMGSTDGMGSSARFFSPSDITTDGTNLYVSDRMNATIRKIGIATGTVTTLAGSAGSQGPTDGIGSAARFSSPFNITTDGTNLYVADYWNYTIRKIVIATGAVTTLAGSAGNQGSADGIGSAARFIGPSGITTDGANLYNADNGIHTVRKIGAVYTITASAGVHGTLSQSVTVDYGSEAFFTITPNAHYHVADVLVDGISVGAVANYRFPSVGADHTISASFAIDTYAITALTDVNGTISSPTPPFEYGSTPIFTITPNAHYHVADVLVDGISAGAVSSYTFTNVTANHTISAIFTIDTFTITASTGANGTMSQSVTVDYGSTPEFTITPDAHYHVADVLVDGQSIGAVTNYRFPNTGADHTISASFAIDTFTITASADANGTISPTATVGYWAGAKFTITPNSGYHLAGIMVDGKSDDTITGYTYPAPYIYSFKNVTANHMISATFALNTPHTITAAAGANGTISSSVTVDYALDAIFTITPNPGYNVYEVLVDGKPFEGKVSGNTFTLPDVTTDQTISATFILKGDVNNDEDVNIKDAITALKVLSNIPLPELSVYKAADINGDAKIGMADVIYILQKLAGVR